MGTRRLILACLVGLACAALAGAAQGQSVDDLLGGAPPLPAEATDALQTAAEPAPYLRQQTSGTVEADTDYTPITKESPYFSLHQGAYYRDENNEGAESEADYTARRAASQNSAAEQVTTWDDELTDVAFSDTRNGFAGGQRKLDCVAADGSPGTDGVPDTYVPVIYRYGDSSTGLRWLKPTEEKGGLLEDCSNPGFVGSIVWLRTTGMALAVGGDGSYPYRAPAFGKDVSGAPCAPDPAKPFGANCDQAGLGRAWLFNHGRWQELDYDKDNFRNRSLSPNDPWGDTLHGMTALEFSPLPSRDFGFAGALGQIRPFLVAVEGQNGACEATDANQCVRFPNEGELAVLGAGASGRFDMDENELPEGPIVTNPDDGVETPAVAGPSGFDQRWFKGDTDHAFRFRFRVRQLRMGLASGGVGAVAVTDGCCAGGPDATEIAGGGGAQLGPAGNYPSVLLFDALAGRGAAHLVGGEGWRWQLWSADLYGQRYEHAAYYGLPEQQRRALPPPNTRQDWPDSFYAVGFRYGQTVGGPASRLSVVASPGGPAPIEGSPERPSLVSEPICFQGDHIGTGANAWLLSWPDLTQPGQPFSALRAQLASVRLMDGDGDELVAFTAPLNPLGEAFPWPPLAVAPSNAQRNTQIPCGQGAETRQDQGTNSPSNHDAVPDWAVGELRSTHRPGLGARGLAFSTVSRPELIPGVLDLGWTGDEAGLTPDPARVLATLADPVNNPPTRQEKLIAYLQSQHFFTGSYALNAIDYLDGFGTGWAVGMHGAIVKLGGSEAGLAGQKRVEPEPPPLGAKRPGQAPERVPYEAFDLLATEPGAVPALGARQPERLAEHAVRPAGAPNAYPDYAGRYNDPRQLILNRDGSEGWGLDGPGSLTAGNKAMTLFHLQGGAWSRCDPEGIDGVLEPDPACKELAPLRAYAVDGKTVGVTIRAAARIPYENDSDAANDDEFEVFAIGTDYPAPWIAPAPGNPPSERPILLRYRDGAWRVEDDHAVREFIGSSSPQMAFAAPDDGWAVAPGSSSGAPSLLHFNGERWIGCSTSLDGDPYATSDVRFSEGSPINDNPEARKAWCDDDEQLTIAATAKEAGSGISVPFAGTKDTQDIDNFTGLATAGSRLYLYGYREVGGQNPMRYPLVLCKDASEDWRSAGCGLDPGLEIRKGRASGGLQGQVNALSVAVDERGNQRGWAAGGFGGDAGRPSDVSGVDVESSGLIAAPRAETALLRLGDDSAWHPYDDEGPIRDGYRSRLSVDTKLIALPDGGGLINGSIRFEHDIGRWRNFPDSGSSNLAIAPDNRGGAWLASGSFLGADLARYTDSPPKPVFGEAPTPLPRKQESFTALAGQPNGVLWASTSDGALYRYARSTGWDRVAIPGWRAKNAIVAPAAYAVAVNDAGVGVAVGREGRIADIAGAEVRLNAAAGTLCDLADVVPPCGTSRHLRAAAVSPEGTAIVGGEQLSLLWRPSATGDFRAIERPEAAPSAEVTGLSLPSAAVAFLVTNQGQLFRGAFRRKGTGCDQPTDEERWCWRLENTDSGDLLTSDPTSAAPPAALRAVAVDAQGHGYAAGERGVLLERVGGERCGSEGAEPCWRLLRSGVSDTLTAIVLRGERALIGGKGGLILTGGGSDFAVARPADRSGGFTGDVVGLALAGGVEQGRTEAWAATDGPGARGGLVNSVSQLLHYTSDESDPLLNPRLARATSLADSPAARAGEVSFAALGKLGCHREHGLCTGVWPGDDHLTLSRHAVEQIAERARDTNGPALALFTGDLTDDVGIAATGTLDSASPPQQVRYQLGPANLVGAAKLRASRRWLAEPLARGGLGFFSAVGAQDLATSQLCPGAGNPGQNPGDSCLPTQELARPGVNDIWREAFAAEPAPWGRSKRFSSERYEVRPLSRSGSQLSIEDPGLGAGDAEPKLPLGGAQTHYAFDLVERESGKKLSRFVFADNSLKSLQASDPFQYPLELEVNESGSGQAGWLQRVLCTKGEGARCSREPGQPAIVVANAPTYSYANGDPRFWAKDGAVFEDLLIKNKATTVISGSLGWNGRYWAVGAGAHIPCQGDPYQDSAPRPGELSCRGRSSEELPAGAGGVAPIANQLASALGPASGSINEAASAVTIAGLLPFVVASGAGGKLQGQEASQGFFHGYTIVRVPGNADPAGVLVEQRPLYDFLSITAASHVLRPGQKMTLRGVGRGPLVNSSDPGAGGARSASFDPIDAAAIGHRYDLVEADPAKPWLPKRAGDPSSGPYVPLDPSVATVDSQSGLIAVGKGNNPRTFALGMLSVGCSGAQAGADGICDPDDPGVHVATYPLVFESRRTFKPVVVAQPRIAQIKARAQAALPQPPNPPQPPAVKGVELPSPPGVPVPPPVQVPNVQPPSPPVPPPPPVQQSPVPLDLSASAPGVTIAPQTTVIPPPAPPIQPAPPGGARREARQRQSATQSSGSGAGETSPIQDSGGDLAQGPESASGSQTMTRVDRTRADGGSMTAYYGASVTLLALVAAFGWNYGRPGPRRRSPYEAAPARAWSRRRY